MRNFQNMELHNYEYECFQLQYMLNKAKSVHVGTWITNEQEGGSIHCP